MEETLYITKLQYEDYEEDFDVFVTLSDCSKIIKSISTRFWAFGENGESKETIIESFKQDNADDRLVAYLERLDQDDFDNIWDAGIWQLIHDVLEDCGELVPTRWTSTIYY